MLILSLAVGAVGVYLAKDFIEKKVNYYKSQLEKTEEMIALVVPNRNIPQGTIISMRDFSIREIPKKYAHANAVNKSNFNTAIGQRVSFDITKGRALLWAHLEGGVMPTFSGKLKPGTRALAFTVDKINSISGFLQPKDNIDLLIEYKDQIIPIIQNLHVLATGPRTRIDKTGRQTDDSFRTITVEVTPEVAEKITLAKSIGKLTALLRSPQDDKPISDQPMTVARLLNKPQPKAKPRKKVVRKAKGIEYIIGGRRS
ncbi:MAG: Flp pilus assembly protein CpaB [Candidatus Thiodiazotropha sp. (ex Lucinoma annulata)]|nr:Flp pilus assembly protein CpaB [Candidatus Thiodiazotropha sp. (ex Troendleina suluensis)]MCU7883585.1 Flp pilus assembly protein CpaB [Candidatus Thiodiazotropha sp. (ex Lucinoma annulata)]